MANYNQFNHDSIKSVNDLFGAMIAINAELENTKKKLETTKKSLLKLKSTKNQQDACFRKRLQEQDTTIKQLKQIGTPPFTMTQQNTIHDEMDAC